MPRDMVNVPAPRRAQQYQAPQARLGRSQVSLSHSHKTSFNVGDLIPYCVQEVIPGDTFTCDTTIFGRVFSGLNAPIMDDIKMNIDWFYVPNRIIWTNWHAFLGEHDDAGAQDTTYTIPTVATGATVLEGSLLHYMGVPMGLSTSAESVQSLPVRAYRLIYNEWYRDQNLIDEINVTTGDGPDAETGATTAFIKKSAKDPDYFTTALPYLQKGTAQVASLTGTVAVATDALDNEDIGVYQSGDGGWRKMDIATGSHVEMDGTAATEYLYADLDLALPGQTVGGISINALREAAAVQRMLEKDARAGTRPNELIRAHFGVDVPDYRIDRPEYLGGATGFINVSPVANTSPVDSTNSPDGLDWNSGQLAGTGAGVVKSRWAKSFVEHGWVLGILRCRGAVSYSQGLDRKWSRSTKYDLLWPELAQLGEQPIYNKELYLQGTSADDDVFGYQERYADYRFAKSIISGQFDPAASSSLDFWHLSEEFSSAPSLNSTFIEDQTPMERVTIDDSQHDFIVDGRIDLRVARVLPVRPVPTLMPARF